MAMIRQAPIQGRSAAAILAQIHRRMAKLMHPGLEWRRASPSWPTKGAVFWLFDPFVAGPISPNEPPHVDRARQQREWPLSGFRSTGAGRQLSEVQQSWRATGRAQFRFTLDRAHQPDCPSAHVDSHTRTLTTVLDKPRMTAFNATRTSWGTINGTTYLDRDAPRLLPAKRGALALYLGLFIEPDPGSNCPDRIWLGWPAFASRFLAFCAAFAFARSRALALVMFPSHFRFALPKYDDLLPQSPKSCWQ
ncbi:MAG: hypothetical protein QF578_09285 [Alphaproteobacteria bacterium]|nr:hypothetical protein [Alphaproteobacteria bacterium]MDP6814452.1 hypothetical protein [Alphaproteobacteria bacterium]